MMMLVFAVVVVLACSVQAGKIESSLDDGFDWRERGVVTPVKNMGFMGNSLHYVIVEELESFFAIHNKSKAILLSTQEFSDCCKPKIHYDVYACIHEMGGLCTLNDYKHISGKCGNDTCKPVATASGTAYVFTEKDMMKYIQTAPLAAYINASPDSFQMYKGGIYSSPQCKSSYVDHVVQVVGYGTEQGRDYWIIRNTWGSAWGEEGYMRLERGTNMCGIATIVFQPMKI